MPASTRDSLACEWRVSRSQLLAPIRCSSVWPAATPSIAIFTPRALSGGRMSRRCPSALVGCEGPSSVQCKADLGTGTRHTACSGPEGEAGWWHEARSGSAGCTYELISISWRVLNLTSTQGHACLLTVERHHHIRPQMSLVTVTGYPRDGTVY